MRLRTLRTVLAALLFVGLAGAVPAGAQGRHTWGRPMMRGVGTPGGRMRGRRHNRYLRRGMGRAHVARNHSRRNFSRPHARR